MSMYHTSTEPEFSRNVGSELQDPRTDADLLEQARAEAQRVRSHRALAEEATYEFGQVRNAGSFPYVRYGGEGLCVGVRTKGGIYCTWEDGRCTCPDAKHTAAQLGVWCKHAVAAIPVFRRARQARENLLHEPREPEAQPVPGVDARRHAEEQEAERRARVQRDHEALFGDAIQFDRELAAARKAA